MLSMYRLQIVVTTLSVILGVHLPASSAIKIFQGASGNDWNNPSLWLATGVPTNADDVILSDPVIASLATDNSAFIDSLTISNGGEVKTGGKRLTVDDSGESGLTTVDGAGGISRILVQRGAVLGTDFNTDNLDLINRGVFRSAGGTTRIDNLMDVDMRSLVLGHGTIRFKNHLNSTGSLLDMNGILTPDVGTTFALRTDNGGTLDLDGTTDNGFLNVFAGSHLVVDAALADEFDGTLRMGLSSAVTFTKEGKL